MRRNSRTLFVTMVAPIARAVSAMSKSLVGPSRSVIDAAAPCIAILAVAVLAALPAVVRALRIDPIEMLRAD